MWLPKRLNNNLPGRIFNFSIGDKRIKELKYGFLVFLRQLIDVLYAVDGGGIEFDIGIADEPVQATMLCILILKNSRFPAIF